MRRLPWWVCPLGKFNAGEVAGQSAISPRKIVRDAAERPLFPPLDQALIHAMACEVIAETKLPLSRQSLADLVGRAQTTLGKKISRSTVWRMLHEAAIKPWQHESWLFRAILGLPRRPGRSWICMEGSGKANRWGRRISC